MTTKILDGVEYEFHAPYGEDVGPYWSPDKADRVAPFICGTCEGREFQVVPAHWSDYETWAFCKCGNKFVVHSG